MNKRIQELAIEAAGKGFNTLATSDLDSQEKIEMFAKLIVLECTKLVDEHDAMGTGIIQGIILKHFGVEAEVVRARTESANNHEFNELA